MTPKAELNRRSQADEVLAEPVFASGEMDEHQGSVPCIPVWKTGVYLSTPMLEKWPASRRARSANNDGLLPAFALSSFGAQPSPEAERRAKAGIPCGNCTHVCGFADRRLSCSANGM